MRIQETNEILKETAHTRKPVEHPGMLRRAWRSLLGLFGIK